MEAVGLLDRCARIERPTRSQDSYGQPIETWSLVESVRAAVKYKTGSEPFQGEQWNAKRVVVFTIRYRTGVDETCRILFNGDEYDIQYIAEVGRRQWLEITATALVPTV